MGRMSGMEEGSSYAALSYILTILVILLFFCPVLRCLGLNYP